MRTRIAFVLLIFAFAGDGRAQTPAATWEAARYAWDAGDFPTALAGLQTLLAGPEADAYLERVALLTGELFRTREVTTDGRSIRWSPDGRMFAFESGSGDTGSTHIRAAAGETLHDLRGAHGLVFSPDGRSAAVIAQSDEGAEARLIDLESGRSEPFAAGLRPLAIAFGPEAGLFLTAGEPRAARIYRLLPDGTPHALTSDAGAYTDPVPLGRTHVLFRRGRADFGVVDLATGATRDVAGEDVAVSADGSTLAWVAGEEGTSMLVVMHLGAEPVVVKRTTDPLETPALSVDGRRIAFVAMPRENREIYLIDADGRNEKRLTHEIQHDLFPRFLPDGRVLAVQGEGRHRRSFLYDPDTRERTRLHHNNTVRTVAPEYEWALSPDGAKLLIVAERDGDTVSPERGVYLMDLTARITVDEVRARVAAQQAAETALRAFGERTFAPIRVEVADAVAGVSTARIHEYASDLFAFDSKYVTQPGNARAIAYIAERLRAWGYEPELQYFTVRPRIRTADGFGQGPEVRTANVIAKLPGTTNPDLIYVVSSHFDSVERGPGADDNSSGTTALLEAARVLRDAPQGATIHFAFFTGEEAGLLGSRHYVRMAVERRDRIVGALNNDMVGYKNDHRVDNTIRYSNAGIRDIQHAAAFLFTDLVTYDAKYYKSTDAAAYYDAYGDIVGGIGSYPILGNPHYHQSHDVLETIDQQLVAEVSKTTVATLLMLANAPARPTGLVLTNGAATWDAAPERDVTEYIVAWGPDGEAPRERLRVRSPRTSLPADLPAGTVVGVKAVNAAGLESWDWARASVH